MKDKFRTILVTALLSNALGFGMGYLACAKSKTAKAADAVVEVKKDFDKAKVVVGEDYGKVKAKVGEDYEGAKRAVGKQKEELYDKLGIKDGTKEDVKNSLKDRLESLKERKFKD